MKTGYNSNTSREDSKYLEFYKASLVLLSDRPSKPVDGLFFFSRARGDDTDDLFNLAVDLNKLGIVGSIVVNGSNGEGVDKVPGSGWAGRSKWEKRLRDSGVKKIIFTDPAFHTREEVDVFLEVAIEKRWSRVAILAHPHQVLRIMLGVVQAINIVRVPISVYTIAPTLTDWNLEVLGSQGKELKPRLAHIQDEIDRIFKYQEKGDLASFSELFDYLSRRG